MERLRLRDLRDVHRFLAKLYEFADVPLLKQRLLATLPALVPAARIAVIEFGGRIGGVIGESSPADAFTDKLRPLHARYLAQSPLVAGYRRGEGPAIKQSDFVTHRELHQLPLYTEYLRRLDIEYVIAKGLPGPPDRVTTLVLDRKQCDFSERDRLVLNVLGPHFNQSYRNAVAASASRLRIEALEDGVETLDRGLVLIAPNGAVQWTSSRARQSFTKYFGSGDGAAGALPEPIRRWLCRQLHAAVDDVPAPHAPLTVTREDCQLVVRLVSRGEHALLQIEEQYLSIPAEGLRGLGLTRREAEVLAWVAEGKTSDEIATILGIGRRGVEKHLEHIYSKLGVETRTAAAIRALAFVAGR